MSSIKYIMFTFSDVLDYPLFNIYGKDLSSNIISYKNEIINIHYNRDVSAYKRVSYNHIEYVVKKYRKIANRYDDKSSKVFAGFIKLNDTLTINDIIENKVEFKITRIYTIGNGSIDKIDCSYQTNDVRNIKSKTILRDIKLKELLK